MPQSSLLAHPLMLVAFLKAELSRAMQVLVPTIALGSAASHILQPCIN